MRDSILRTDSKVKDKINSTIKNYRHITSDLQTKNINNQKEKEISERKITNIALISKKGSDEICRSQYTPIDSKWPPSVTSSEIEINTINNNKNNTTNRTKSEINNTQQKIDQLNITKYYTNIQKYLASRKRINIITRRKKEVRYKN